RHTQSRISASRLHITPACHDIHQKRQPLRAYLSQTHASAPTEFDVHVTHDTGGTDIPALIRNLNTGNLNLPE
ncbi:hypothetical protein, partial [uncultured Duncaniella sp.]|uniref:hypothetical protein n=1 Tax=uncultured Duncaniella sp. TaxID=2768039 RepID=UPI0025B6E165